jgi:hypothetical protein
LWRTASGFINDSARHVALSRPAPITPTRRGCARFAIAGIFRLGFSLVPRRRAAKENTMASGVSVGARWHAARRITNIVGTILGLIVVLAAPAEPLAQTGSQPLIKIPPAQLPPVAAATPSPAAGPPSIQPAPRALLPTHVQILHDSQGAGLALYGALTGKADSAAGVILAIFVNSGAFDPSPSVKLLIADEADRRAQALFTATVKGVPVTGIAVAALSDSGGDVTVFYDAAAAFVASFPRMRAALAQSDGVGMAELSALRLGDGNTVNIPPGWEATTQGVGSVTLQGRQGEVMSLGAVYPVYTNPDTSSLHILQGPCCDPVNAFAALYPQIIAAPRPGVPPQEPGNIIESQSVTDQADGKVALILSHVRVSGDDYAYLARAETTAGFTDPWTFRLSGVMAPQPIFVAELPTLLQIWKSYSGARPGSDDALQRALNNMSTTQEMLKLSITARETTDYNAAPGWDPVITALTEGKIDPSLVQSLVARIAGDTNHPWRIVAQAEAK